MTDYNAMSDFEINKRVAEHRGFKVVTKTPKKGLLVVNTGDAIGAFDPCNNPADAWPIIVELINEGTLCFGDGYCTLIPKPLNYAQGIKDKNPLRAAMIVYLMMMEGE